MLTAASRPPSLVNWQVACGKGLGGASGRSATHACLTLTGPSLSNHKGVHSKTALGRSEMSRTAAQLTPQDVAIYQVAARRRWAREQQEMARKRERAWALARRAAVVLREQFGARQVALFGSLARGDLFHYRSDVDLATWGLDEAVYYRAVSQLLSLDPAIEVDLVIAETAPAALRAVIHAEGVPV